MNGKEIIDYLEKNYDNGLSTLKYNQRYQNGMDMRREKIHMLMDNFDCSYGIAKRLVGKVNGF